MSAAKHIAVNRGVKGKHKSLKTARQAVVELAMLPQYEPLRWIIYANDFIKRLDERVGLCVQHAFVKRGILHLRTKSTLHFAELKHQSVCEYISENLKIYAKKKPLSEFDKIKSVKILPPLRLVRDERFKNGIRLNAHIEELPLQERSKGTFENAFTSERLKEGFEKLRAAICARGKRLGVRAD